MALPAVNLTALEAGAFPAAAADALAPGTRWPPPAALSALAAAVLIRADAAVEAALGYGHVMRLAQTVAAAPRTEL